MTGWKSDAKENLFTWPLNFFPYQREEVAVVIFHFRDMKMEICSCLGAKRESVPTRTMIRRVALEYVGKALDRYNVDGLSFQRYLRQSQSGAGEDILAGNCMPVVGLYRDTTEFSPSPIGFISNLTVTSALNGTTIRYPLRGQLYVVDLSTAGCGLTAGAGTLRAPCPFGANATATGLEYFAGTNTDWAMSISRPNSQPLTVRIQSWRDAAGLPRQWTESSPQVRGTTAHVVTHLQPDAIYELKANGRVIASLRSDKAGRIEFAYKGGYAVRRSSSLA